MPSFRIPTPVFALLTLGFMLGAKDTATATWQDDCGQLIAVITDDWKSTGGRMICLERGMKGWRVCQDWSAVTVGRKGMGLGLGLHGDLLKGPQKKEGDKRAPAGIFRLEGGFGTDALSLANFPYRRTSAVDFWVDDPKSQYYNLWVNRADPGIMEDWKSAEVLRRKDGFYDFGIVIGHNRDPIVPGRGSAIFVHVWAGPGVPTTGCTAMEKARVRALLQWLDASKAPVIVQAPKGLLPALPLSGEVLQLIGGQ